MLTLFLPAAGRGQQAIFVDAFPGLTFNKPVFFASPPDSSRRAFVVQQDGLIRVFPNDSTASDSTIFLDLSQTISSFSGEEGLLGLAFPPDFAASGLFYVHYTAFRPGNDRKMQVVISRFAVSRSNPDSADPASETRLLMIDKPDQGGPSFQNHNGGMLAFGPDSLLYIGVGDGGNGNDPFNNAQNLASLLGKILRIDVSGGGAYRIPPTNPFAGNPNGWREEIWAYGLRNPWRFSFDPTTGLLWAGDVGQNAREEVDTITRGGNYGWKIMEGNICRPGGGPSCDPTGLVPPVKDYDRSLGISITGGYVYRGSRRPDLVGAYIYGDFGSGNIWTLRSDQGRITEDTLLVRSPFNISSFGVDQQHELYLTDYTGGKIYRFAPGSSIHHDDDLLPPGLPVLQQNRPNPSSGLTQVTFTVPAPGPVTLQVFDLLGREVLSVLNASMEARNYTVSINTSGLASGTYYYRLVAPGVNEVRRMSIVR